MRQVNQLTDILAGHLVMNRARLTLISMFILSLLKVKTINFVDISKGMAGLAKKESKYRRIQRFFSEVYPNTRHVSQLILSILPQKTDFLMSIDRTQWQFGRFVINIMMVAIVYKGVGIPIVWCLLPKKG